MASIKARKRSDGGTSFRVTWRLGGGRDGAWQSETFTSRQRAERFAAMVDEARHHWPEGWVKGYGFGREVAPANPLTFSDALARYVDQLTDVQPATRDRYKGQVRTLGKWECCDPRHPGRTYRPFGRNLGDVTEEDVRHWINKWPRTPKTKRNYLHALLSPAFAWAVKNGYVEKNPCQGVRAGQRTAKADVRHLSESQFALLKSLAHEDIRDLMEVAVGTGLRFGEITALLASAVDLAQKTITVDMAWKRQGEGWENDPVHVALVRKGVIQPKHRMRGHYLGAPKTKKSYRVISISESVAGILTRNLVGKTHDDFVFTSPTGKPLHQGDFHEDRWQPLLKAASAAGLPVRPRFHDLRHTHAVWLITAGVPLSVIQHRLGHDSITTTNDTYGGFLPQASALADQAIDRALGGAKIRSTLSPHSKTP